MESHRKEYRMTSGRARTQAGITVIGFLLLACVFGLIGLGGMRLVPIYLENMRLETILDDLEKDSARSSVSPQLIRTELAKRFSIEGVRVPTENVKIAQVNEGFQVSIEYENRAPFIADIWFLVAFNKQVLIKR